MDVGIVKNNNISVYLTLFGCLFFSYFISSIIPKGFFRLISLLPLFYYLAAVIHLPPVLVAAGSLILVISLVNYAAFEQRQRSSSAAESLKKSVNFGYVAVEILVSSVLICVLLCHQNEFHPKILLVIYGCLVLLGVDCLGTVSNLMLHFTVGLELESPSDRPYLSTSLQDFWGKRWNLTVTKNLWRTVYSPVKSASAAVVQGNKLLASLAAVTATFLVSGLFHELLLYFLTGGAKPTWEMTSFFLLHGFCVALEVAIKKKASNGRWETELPLWVSGPLTIGFVMLTSFWLFFPPLIRSGADKMVLEQLRTFAEFAGIQC
ncbi:OLC1v1035656C1 [Oldenlandia corymbosa var. corymbosa]|uniref:OLC1v1035656C1 n=1 Tax=Oldenlandia corymbosa var. corymbosa TaxID=529605 RepID=A0AAV1CWN0_OLDCO|nr:OLC1v1035656C1 [Oldenlandia corymbosa var. corymbosa]